MTISIKPTSTETIIQQNGTDSLVFDNDGNIESRQSLYPTVPAFAATPSAGQTLSSGTWTTIAFNTEVFDTNSNYNTSTYAFTPTVAGYYNFTAVIRSNAATTRFFTKFVKNASTNFWGNDFNFSANGLISNYSALIYMNGSTDTVVTQAFMQGGGGLTTDYGTQIQYSAHLTSYKYIAPPSTQTPTESDNLQAFSGTGSDATWTVPDGVSRVLVKIWGAGGGHPTFGGPGGFTKGLLVVTAGETLTFRVGRTHTAEDSGTDCSGQCSGKDFIGGFGGGGRGREGNGGGGGSYIFRGGTNFSNVLAAAGGGGFDDVGGAHVRVRRAAHVRDRRHDHSHAKEERLQQPEAQLPRVELVASCHRVRSRKASRGGQARGEESDGEACRREEHGVPPPPLPIGQLGSGHARKLWREADTRETHEDGPADDAALQAASDADVHVVERREAEEKEREAKGDDDVGEQGECAALGAVRGSPLLSQCTPPFIDLGFKNQGHDANVLEAGGEGGHEECRCKTGRQQL